MLLDAQYKQWSATQWSTLGIWLVNIWLWLVSPYGKHSIDLFDASYSYGVTAIFHWIVMIFLSYICLRPFGVRIKDLSITYVKLVLVVIAEIIVRIIGYTNSRVSWTVWEWFALLGVIAVMIIVGLDSYYFSYEEVDE